MPTHDSTDETARDPTTGSAPPRFAETFTALQSLLLSIEGVDVFLQEVAVLASRIVVPSASCGITVRRDGQPLTVASSDARARALDESQYAVRDGSCLHAMRSGQVVEVPDVDAETRWPRYIAAARAQGLRSSLSLPLIVAGESIGAINLYSRERTGAFGPQTRGYAEIFAAQASTALLLALRQARMSETNEQLETALTSRSVIDQALGVIMATRGGSADEAFDVLRAQSQNDNRKLRDVATEIVVRASARRPGPEPR